MTQREITSIDNRANIIILANARLWPHCAENSDQININSELPRGGKKEVDRLRIVAVDKTRAPSTGTDPFIAPDVTRVIVKELQLFCFRAKVITRSLAYGLIHGETRARTKEKNRCVTRSIHLVARKSYSLLVILVIVALIPIPISARVHMYARSSRNRFTAIIFHRVMHSTRARALSMKFSAGVSIR